MAGVIETLANAVSFRQIVLREGDTNFTCTEVVHKVQQVARTIRRAGFKRIGLHADNSAAWLFADLACQEANVACVPLPLFFTAAQRKWALQVCGIDALLTSAPDLFTDLFTLDKKFTDVPLSLMLNAEASGLALPEDTSKISFTAGATGSPKGVCLSTVQQLAQAKAIAHAVQIQSPVHLCVLPLNYLMENVAGAYATLQAGGTVIIRSLSELGYVGNRMLEPQKFLDALIAVQPDTLVLTPNLLQILVHAVKQGWQPPLMKFIAVGGGIVSAALITEARALELPVYEGYALVEGASFVSLNTPRTDQAGSCGLPLPHVQIEIEQFEITINGNSMLGYAGEPGSWNQERIYTGDLGYMDDWGFLHLTGRRGNLLLSSHGQIISPEWVESELLSSPLLAEAMVVGNSRDYCVALLTARKPEISDRVLAEVVASANIRLPDYAQVKDWLRVEQPFSEDAELMLENGQLHRERIALKYRSQIEALYKERGV
ncbi:MAG: AMP-binding protein [Pseudomonadota bacterium]